MAVLHQIAARIATLGRLTLVGAALLLAAPTPAAAHAELVLANPRPGTCRSRQAQW